MSNSESNASTADPDYLPFHPNPKIPDTALPSGACDAHCHVFGPAAVFPFASTSTYRPVDASKETLFQRHAHLGIERAVIVQASCHGTDNSATLDALDASGGNYRGVAVVAEDIELAALEDMHERGIRGVRFNFVKRLGGTPPGRKHQRILEKIKRHDWHVVVYFDSEDIATLAPFLDDIDAPVVIDHMGRVPVESGTSSQSFEDCSNKTNTGSKSVARSGCRKSAHPTVMWNQWHKHCCNTPLSVFSGVRIGHTRI